MARLHRTGNFCKYVNNGNLLINEGELAILDPLALHKLPGTGVEHLCSYELLQLCASQQYNPEEIQLCCNLYLANIDEEKRRKLEPIMLQLLAERARHTDNARDHDAAASRNDTGPSTTS